MAVDIQQPQAQGRRISVEHNRRVTVDTGVGHEPLQGGRSNGVVLGVFQIGVDVPQHCAIDVPVVVRGRADVDFDHPHRGL